MRDTDVPATVHLQKAAFPPPFSEDLHWDPEHLLHHIKIFPEGQFVAESEGCIIGSCSNTVISEPQWAKHGGWSATVGGPFLRGFDRAGTTLYGLDITVHPEHRRIGVGRAFYAARFDLVNLLGLTRYGTACRVPDYRSYAATYPGLSVEEYVHRVIRGETNDRTLTPLLRMGLSFLEVLNDYMEDEESANAAALLEWRP